MGQHRLTEAMYVELEEIRKKDHSGRLLAPDVLAVAENPSSALHWAFTWDDTKASRLYRLQQAGALIRTAVSILASKSEPVRTYVSLEQDRRNGGGYRATAEVLTEEESRARLLDDALRALRALERRYQCLQELAAVFAAADAAADAIASGKTTTTKSKTRAKSK